jgi:5,5'-dehydrodivanillate O-demethylase
MTEPDPESEKPEWFDFFHTAPDRLAGHYLRQFWHPIFHTDDLPAGRTKPLKIMNVGYTLYRGEDGQPYLTQFRCPHRGLQLSAGGVEGNAIRCMYHGWKFDCEGSCVEQPAEPNPFLDKVRIKTYSCKDYLGFIFACLTSAPMEQISGIA